MLATDAPELGIVAKEVRELRTLLYEVNVRETGHLLSEVRYSNQLAEDETGVVEAQRLVEVARDQVVAGRRRSHRHIGTPTLWMQG